MKNTIYDNKYAKAINLKVDAERTIPYLVSNREQIVLTDDEVRNITNINLISNSPVAKLARRIIDTGKLSEYMFMDVSRSNAPVPERLTDNLILIDGKHLNTSVRGVDKIWINLTPILTKRRAKSDPILVNDIPQLCNQLFLGMLSITYNDSDLWLNHQLAPFIIESYAATITSVVRTLMGLDPMESREVEILFAAMYAQMIGREDSDLQYPPLLTNCSTLGSYAEIRVTLDKIQPVRDSGGKDLLSIDKIVKALPLISPKLKKITSAKITQMFSANPISARAMMMAMECPPYWVYQLVHAASATQNKNHIIMNMFRQTHMKKRAIKFTEELIKSNVFITKGR